MRKQKGGLWGGTSLAGSLDASDRLPGGVPRGEKGVATKASEFGMEVADLEEYIGLFQMFDQDGSGATLSLSTRQLAWPPTSVFAVYASVLCDHV